MDVDDAIIAADFIKCDNILGVHYDTFGFIEINKSKQKKNSKKNKTLHLLEIDETTEL